jgi:Cu/Ag efflux protein CusF
MRKLLFLLLITVCGLAFQPPARSQAAGQGQPSTGAKSGISPNRVIGEVTAIDADAKQITLKTDGGESVTVLLSEQTVYMRVPPGATTLDNRTPIALTDIGIGDRVLALGKVAEDGKSVPARQVIVMTKADIAQKHERDRAEWQRRGILGVITALDPAKKEITLQMRSRISGDGGPITVEAGKARFRRYAPDSVKFSDAKPSDFSELKVGDQLRALGEKSADGARYTAEEIVSGSFQTIGGTITAIKPETNEITLKTLGEGHTITVVINKDSTLRRIPPEMGARLAMMSQRMSGGADRPGAQGPGRPGGSGPGQPADAGGPGAMRRPGGSGEGPGRGSGEGLGQGAGPGGMRRMGGDMQDFLERLPQITIADLKAGDTVIVSSTKGADASRATAIALVAGLDALLSMPAPASATAPAGPGLSTGLPAGLDIGIGLP